MLSQIGLFLTVKQEKLGNQILKLLDQAKDTKLSHYFLSFYSILKQTLMELRSYLQIVLKKFILGLCFFSIIASAKPSEIFEPVLHFEKLQNNLDTSSPVVNDIVSDNDGYIWIATNDGLNRYNGQQIVQYRPSKTQDNFLNHFSINSLMIDSKGVLWIATKMGINVYNSKQDNFTSFDLSIGPNSLKNDRNIVKLFLDTHNRIWFSTYTGGLYLISSERNSIKKIEFKATKTSKISVYYRDILELENNQIVAASNVGFFYFNESTGLIEQETPQPKFKLLNIVKTQVINNDKILVGTTKGLYIYDVKTREYSIIESNIFSEKNINTFDILDEQRLLIGTGNSGVFILNLDDFTVIKARNDKSKDNFSASGVRSIFRSKNGIIWVGTNTGIRTLNPNSIKFHHVSTDIEKPDCISGNTLYSILKDSKDNLWIAAFGSGLHKIDLKTKKCHIITDIDNIETADAIKNTVTLFEDSDSNIWIGTHSEGIFKYIREKEEIEKLSPLGNKKDIDSLKYISAIISDDDEKIWFTTRNANFFEYIKSDNSIVKRIPTSSKAPDIKVVGINNLVIDRKGVIWLATENSGLWTFDTKTVSYAKITSKNIGGNIPESLISIMFDSDDNLWIGSRGEGVVKYSQKKQKVTKYTTDNGLLNNVILRILQDSNGYMWFFTDNGLSRLSNSDNTITTFLEKDGLQADAFTNTSFYDKENNTIWTGGINGFNYFDPTDIEEEHSQHTVFIDQLELFYKPVAIGDESGLIDSVISKTKTLNLDYNQNVFAFSFSAIEFIYPERIKYAFKLAGYDKDWNYVDAKRRYASYTNIDPGDYQFKVKASNKFGEWSDLETSIDISISPPWWKTPVAYFAYFLLIFISLYSFLRIRTKVLEERSKALEATVKKRTLELAEEKHKVEQLLSRKNEEFANVSHEFRTPLTLILGPLAQVLKTNKNTQELSRLNIIQRNSYRLLRMVDQLLNLETFRIKSITQKSPQATGKMLKLLTEAFADLAKEKHIELICKQIADINFEFTPDALEKIILNLLSNAIKYTKANGQITVESLRTNNNELSIQVSDTGIGIPSDKLDSIFERYNRVLDENSEQVTGAGIGLALVKELVEAHQGRINIESQLGKGTTITVYLPIIGEVEEHQVNAHSNDEVIAMELMGLTSQSFSDTQPVEMSDQSANNKPVVLVIEDNADMRNYIESSIIDEYQVICANDGEAGIALAIAEVPDLIISDVMMPKKDGYQTTNELRSNPVTNHIPIILLTARGDRESRLKGWYEKADEYLTKPFDVEELKIRLKSLLEIRNILKKRFAETAFQPTQLESKEKPLELETDKLSQQEEFVEQLNLQLENFYSDTSSSVAQMATSVAMSERQLYRKLKSILDMTPSEYLRRFRLEKAKQFLTDGKSASFAAFEVGFSSQSYFGKCFKAQYGYSPKDYKTNLSD